MDFKKRLKEECDQLEDRIGKLKDFLNSDRFNGLGARQQSLLIEQYGAMTTYSEILRARIEDLVISKEERKGIMRPFLKQ